MSKHTVIRSVAYFLRLSQPLGKCPVRILGERESPMFSTLLLRLWTDDQGQDIAEYAVMLAVILVLVVGTILLVGSNANTAFATVAS